MKTLQVRDIGEFPGEARLTRLLFFAALIVAGCYVYFALVRFFMLDDFPLLVRSGDLASVVETIGGRLKPVARFHFFLFSWISMSPVWFNLVSLGLHATAAVSLYLALRELYGDRISKIAGLVFFIHFSYNEAVAWVSAVPVVYCLIFCCLSVFFVESKRWRPAVAVLILASLSYELWLVLPLFFTLRKEWRLAAVGFGLAAVHGLTAWWVGFSAAGYGGLPALSELPLRIVFYLYRMFLPFSSLPGILLAVVLVILMTAILGFGLRRRFEWVVFPFTWYMVPAAVFLFSSYLPSRFFYFPAAAVAVGAALLMGLRHPLRLVGYVVIGYLVLMSLPIHVLDGIDYRDFSREGERLLRQGQPALGLKAGDTVLLVNRVNRSFPKEYTRRLRGRPKLLFERKGGLGGLIYPGDYVDFLLLPRGLRAEPHDDCGDARRLEIGSGPVVSTHCFIVHHE